jgi:hypothetical protein
MFFDPSQKTGCLRPFLRHRDKPKINFFAENQAGRQKKAGSYQYDAMGGTDKHRGKTFGVER